ncbi:hypothetical protein [Rothia halotolerans]|uniref:hypothetical protein n=1 Tax=Rothia halotolerans TaxID=405770 RepID=UPI00101CE4EB|nr:hypothetical protein [Rothia halotolerans]
MGIAEEAQIVRMGEVPLGSPLAPEPGTFLRLDVLVGLVAVPALLWVNPECSDRLLVLTNGAVAREESKSPLEVFQRRTWADQFHAHVLYLSDPTLRPENDLRIGWGQGEADRYALPAMAQAVQYVSECLDVPSHQHLYYGSSAGGFQALQLAARDDGSYALVNNPQVDWSKYVSYFPRKAAEYAYGTSDVESVRQEFPDRVSAAKAIEDLGYIPKIRYLVNAASKNDIEAQLSEFMRGVKSSGSRLADTKVDISVYYDKALGHWPLPKPRTLAAINHSLAEGNS